MILENFYEFAYRSDLTDILQEHVYEFKRLWARHAPEHKRAIPALALIPLLKKVRAPLGPGEASRLGDSNSLKFIKALDLPVQADGTISFKSTLVALYGVHSGCPLPESLEAVKDVRRIMRGDNPITRNELKRSLRVKATRSRVMSITTAADRASVFQMIQQHYEKEVDLATKPLTHDLITAYEYILILRMQRRWRLRIRSIRRKRGTLETLDEGAERVRVPALCLVFCFRFFYFIFIFLNFIFILFSRLLDY